MTQKRLTVREIVKGSLFFPRFLAKKSNLEIELELHFEGDTDKTVVRLPELMVREEADEEILKALHVYYPVSQAGLKSVTMRSFLDVLGDGRFHVPPLGKTSPMEARFVPIIGGYNTIRYRYPTEDGRDTNLTDGYKTIRTSELDEAHYSTQSIPSDESGG